MDRPAAIPPASAVAGPQRGTVGRRASAAPPPPGTYAPRLPAPTAHADAGPRPQAVRTDPELSPAARRCLREIVELLDRATALLREHAGGAPAAATLTPRLVAVELAVAGHDRVAVRQRLVSEFALSDPGAVLDEVFGKGTPGHQRLPGTRGAGTGGGPRV